MIIALGWREHRLYGERVRRGWRSHERVTGAGSSYGFTKMPRGNALKGDESNARQLPCQASPPPTRCHSSNLRSSWWALAGELVATTSCLVLGAACRRKAPSCCAVRRCPTNAASKLRDDLQLLHHTNCTCSAPSVLSQTSHLTVCSPRCTVARLYCTDDTLAHCLGNQTISRQDT